MTIRESFGVDPVAWETVVARDITDETVLDHVTIEGFSPTGAGESTYAMRMHNADALRIQSSLIIAGDGVKGSNGADGSVVACARAAGGSLGSGFTNYNCSKGPGTRGWSGSNGAVPASSGLIAAQGGVGGYSACNNQASVTAGEDGAQGQNGRNGTHGRVALQLEGSIDADGYWVSPQGMNATDGGAAGGGGGGGGGGSYDDDEAFGALGWGGRGGDGGRGGVGGCPGGAGANGHAGGSSFGIIVTAGTMTLLNSTIQLGTGGQGGDGGRGGYGERGAQGTSGTAGSPLIRSINNQVLGIGARGGNGGPGGTGGEGGHGAGGSGGLSIGVALVGSSSITERDVVYDTSYGAGGFGGYGADGSAARDGLQRPRQSYP